MKSSKSLLSAPSLLLPSLLLVLCLLVGCGSSADTPSPAESTASEPTAESAEKPVESRSTPAEAPADAWWQRLQDLCGQAFEGRLVSKDEVDADLADQLMVMHVRKCEPERLEIPFHIGDNRSRTWVLTRKADGIHLQHDHRHEDGSEDEVTLYGGLTRDAGTADAQSFPVDDYSIELFEKHGLSASVVNIWSMQVVPGERFSYILRRPNRHFQADFDLSRPVDPPPAPWGHEDVPESSDS